MNRLGPHTMPIAPGRVAAPRRTPGGHRGKIFTHVLVIHLLILFGPIGYLAFENWRNPPEENAFRVKIGGLRFCLGVLMQCGFQISGIFLLLLVQFLQVRFQRGDVFAEGFGPGVLGILMRWPAVSCPG